MAARRLTGKQSDGMFWSTPAGADKDSFVPGVTDVNNLRPRVKGGRTKEVKASIPVTQSVVQVLDPHPSIISNSTVLSNSHSNEQNKQISLRDLCVKDKKRVADLIKELAKLGEEKENAEKNLEEERHHYEEQILKLVEQQEQILKEREEVQSKLSEYENYILKLQQQQRELQQKQLQQIDALLTERQQLTYSHIGPEIVQPVHPVSQHALHVIGEKDVNILKTPSKVILQPVADESCFEGCSTHALPSHSWIDDHHERPFTARIDKELDHQNQIIVATLSSQSPFKSKSVTNSPSASDKVRDRMSPNVNSCKAQSPRECKHDFVHHLPLNEQQFGNTDLLTPEKNDLIFRLIESQSKFKLLNEDGTENLENQLDGHQSHKEVKRKHKKRPPPSYGPLHPPIMSSTQKSSEIGEEIDSILTFDPATVDKKLRVAVEVKDENSNNNCNDHAHSSDSPKTGQKKNSVTKSPRVKKPEEKASPEDEIERLQQAGVDQEFLRKYKKMSPTERKQELLRQRAMLLEEQNRLKILLAEREDHLKKQQREMVKSCAGEEAVENKGKKHKNISISKNSQEPVRKVDRNDNENSSRRKVSESSNSSSPKTDHKNLKDKSWHAAVNEQNNEEKDLPERKLDGKDGDGCILYSEWPTEGIVKKLDYSESESTQSSIKFKSPRALPREAAASSGKSSVHKSQIDKSTSFSYVHVPRMSSPLNFGMKQNFKEDVKAGSVSPLAKKSDSGKSGRKLSSSVGEKTLSVLEIINTLSENESPAINSPDGARNTPSVSSLSSGTNSDCERSVDHIHLRKTQPPAQRSHKKAVIQNDSDPNLKLFVLKRNFEDSKARSNLVSKYKKSQVNEHGNIQGLNKVLPVSLSLSVEGDQKDPHKIKTISPNIKNLCPSNYNDDLDNVLEAIESLEDSNSTKGLDIEDDLVELEESQILEDVFFL
ncbi:hypothetical protein Btru_004969 [Bulinus truncatus]|nr:hypothetical protein Btru_004969 [Bulinus truncatus]